MTRAAGVLFMAGQRALFLRRGAGGDYPGYWGFPGGRQEEADADAEACALRETLEETGFDAAALTLRLHTRRISGSPEVINPNVPEPVDFTTFLARVPEEFAPELNDEHTAWTWADVSEPPQPLHPGAQVALDRLTMNELGVARAMAAGELASPQRYENVWLFVLRITGTGVSYRDKIDEYVNRPPEVWLTDDAVARCNGLAVIYEHPKKTLLNSDEFADRVIGAVMLPFVRGPDLMGVAKVYDADAAEEMASEPMSTSPGVNFGVRGTNIRFKLAGGETVLLEGDPSLVDHIAVCPRGVWDKGGAPTGVENETTSAYGDTVMAEEKGDLNEEISDAAAAHSKLDAIMDMMKDACSKMDAATGRMDAMEAKMDSMGSRMDAMRKDEEKPEDEKKADAAEGEVKEPAEPVEAAADKARKDAEDKAKMDAEEREKEEAHADAATRAALDDVRGRIASVESRLPRALTPVEREEFSRIQEQAERVYHAFGDRAGPPLEGETPTAYTRRLAAKYQSHSKRFAKSRLSAIPDQDTLGVIVQDIYADAMEAANRGVDMPAGHIRAIKNTSDAGHTHITYEGNDPTGWMHTFTGRARAATGDWRVPGRN